MPDDSDQSNSKAIRLANALSSSGLSITLTSLCSVVAFLVGSAVDIPGVSAFCVYAAWSFLANYILQFLVFVPLMVIDDHRIRKKMNFCCPCCWSHGHHEQEMADIVSAHSTKTTNTSSDPPSTVDLEGDSKQHKDSWLSQMLVPVMTNRISRWLIIILFLCTLSGSFYVIPSISTGNDVQTYVPDDSMILDSLDVVDALWGGTKVIEQDIIIKNQDFSDIAVRDKVYELMADLESQDDALDAVTNWLDEFEFFLNETGQDMNTMDSSEFHSELQSFSNGTRWESEIIYDDPLNPTQIQSTRFKLPAKGDPRFNDWYDGYMAWNDLFDEYLPSNDDGFVFHSDSMHSFSEHIILSLTTSNMLFAGIGVFSVLLFFIDLRMAVFLLVIVSMIDVHLMAWMWALGITLDGTSYLVCVMAVGLTVDYVIHITHSIAEALPEGDMTSRSHSESYSAKLKIAIKTMGVSVWYVFL